VEVHSSALLIRYPFRQDRDRSRLDGHVDYWGLLDSFAICSPLYSMELFRASAQQEGTESLPVLATIRRDRPRRRCGVRLQPFDGAWITGTRKFAGAHICGGTFERIPLQAGGVIGSQDHACFEV
jgi:hypothetical protein